MRRASESYSSLAQISEQVDEDWRTIRGKNVGGVMTSARKTFSKLGQFVERQKD